MSDINRFDSLGILLQILEPAWAYRILTTGSKGCSPLYQER
jgi:hypothetical protein